MNNFIETSEIPDTFTLTDGITSYFKINKIAKEFAKELKKQNDKVEGKERLENCQLGLMMINSGRVKEEDVVELITEIIAELKAIKKLIKG